MINRYSVMLNENRVPYLKLDESIKYDGEDRLQTPKMVVDLVNTVFELKDCAEEHLITLAMTAKCQVVGLFHTAHGTLSSTEASPRNIIQRALLSGAAIFIVCHNHPSGDCMPSDEDIYAAEKIKDAGNLVGISLSDFIIIGNDRYFSFREEKML